MVNVVGVPCTLQLTPSGKVGVLGTLSIHEPDVKPSNVKAEPGSAAPTAVLTWTPDTDGACEEVSVPCASILRMLSNPAAKGGAAKLKLCLSSNTKGPAYVLLFSTPGATATQSDWAARESVATQLRRLRPAARRVAGGTGGGGGGGSKGAGKGSKGKGKATVTAAAPAAMTTSKVSSQPSVAAEMAVLRQEALEADDALMDAYAEVVTTGLVTEDAFWERHQGHLVDAAAKRQRQGLASGTASIEENRGEAGTTLEMRLTAPIIQKIFREEPGVHAAYLDKVPLQMTEQDFWITYMRSRHYHRKRQHRNEDADDDTSMFTAYDVAVRAKAAAEAARQVAQARVDSTVDLTTTAADRLRWRAGYGTTDADALYADDDTDPRPPPASASASAASAGGAAASSSSRSGRRPKSNVTVAQAIINKANLYSAAVVAELPATAPAPVRSVSDGAADDDFEDLRGASAPALVTLKLSSQQGYFDTGASAGAGGGAGAGAGAGHATLPAADSVQGVNPRRAVPQQGDAAAGNAALTTFARLPYEIGLSAKGAGRVAEHAPARAIIAQLPEFNKVDNELLRHFWAALSEPGADAAQRVQRLREAIEQRLAVLNDRWTQLRTAEAEERSEMGPVVRSLMRPLETALDNCDRILRQRAEREAARERKKAAAKANGASRKRALPAS